MYQRGARLKERERKKTTSVTRQSIVRTEGRKPKSNDRFPFNSLTRRKSRGKKSEEIKKKRTHPSLLRGRCQFRRSRSAAAGERSFGERHRASSQHDDEDGLFFLKKFDTSRSRVFFSSLHHGEKSFEKKNEREQFYDRS
jgi:hypothetical protein